MKGPGLGFLGLLLLVGSAGGGSDGGPYGRRPAARVEWWYVTGWLRDEKGRLYGYQATWFRVGMRRERRAARLAVGDLYFFHGALTDAAARRHLFAETASRGGDGWAGARTQGLGVWCLERVLAARGERWSLDARAGAARLRLTLYPTRPALGHGEPPGWVRKAPGRRSGYWSHTRLRTRGVLCRPGTPPRRVVGVSWFDHEWGSGALPPDVVGWDWFSVALPDGGDLMLYVLRRRDGTPSPFSGGTYRDAQGRRRVLGPEDFRVTVRRWWRSPRSGARYPAAWRLAVPALGEVLTVAPVLPDQEVRAPRIGITYWEGLCRFRSRRGTALGYVELVGYARPVRIGAPR